MRRRCSYLTLGDRGTCLGYGFAVGRVDRYVIVVPDGGGERLRVLAAYLDFEPRSDPYHVVPPAAQDVIDRFGLTTQADANPAPRPGERAIHQAAIRVWSGTAAGADDGSAWMALAQPLGWDPDPAYGAWPEVVESFRAHDPKDDPDQSGRWFVCLRLTYLERSLYLASYLTLQAARDDAWKDTVG